MPVDRTRRRFLTALTCLSAGAVAACCLPHRALASQHFALTEIAEGVFAFRGKDELMSSGNQGAICNLGIVVGAEAVAAIDSGGSLAEARAFMAAIGEVTDKPIRFLINTHMHPDHTFGNAAFRDVGATLIGHENLPRALAARSAFYLRSYREQIGEALMEGIEIVPPTLLVSDSFQLDLGGRVLDLRAWDAAHTDNDVTVFDARTRTLFAGDLVFLKHLPTLDGSLLGWMRQMDSLSAIDARFVVPGHGPLAVAWPEALEAQRRYFDVLAGDIRQAIAAGRPLAEAVKTAGRSQKPYWALFDEYNERNATAAYAELEWE